MANVDAKTRLNLKIGAAKHSLPLYDDYKDFYNGKYIRIRAFNKDLYAPLTTTRSDMSVNAGVILDGTRYYFLVSAFEQGEAFESAGAFYHYSNDGNHYQLQKVLNAVVSVPEDGLYSVDIKVKWEIGYNDHHNYRDCSYYRLVSKFNGETLTDTGIHNAEYSLFRPYCVRSHVSDGSRRQWFTMGSDIEVELKAGANTFELWVEMYDTNNKHADMYVDPFQVQATYSGYKNYLKLVSTQNWVCPQGVTRVNYSLYGAGGGNGGTFRSRHDSDNDSGYSYVGTGGTGGTGELISGTANVTPGQEYSLVVGKAGTNGSDVTYSESHAGSAGNGTAGGNTTAFGATARGGGGGTGGWVETWRDDGWSFYEDHNGSNGTSYAGGASAGQDGWIILRYND